MAMAFRHPKTAIESESSHGKIEPAILPFSPPSSKPNHTSNKTLNGVDKLNLCGFFAEKETRKL